MPNSLLINPCDSTTAGDTVRSLAKGYVANTNCISKYKLLVEKQIKYKNEIENLYKEEAQK